MKPNKKYKYFSLKILEMSAATANSERRIITSAIATLIYRDQNYLEHGISFDDLVKTASFQAECTKKQLETIVHKELNSGSLVRLSNGNLALGPADHDADSSDSIKFEYNADSNTKVHYYYINDFTNDLLMIFTIIA